MERNQRRALRWLIGTGVIAFVILLALRQWLTPWWLGTFEQLLETNSLDAARYFLAVTFALAVLPLWTLAGWLLWLAQQVQHSEQYPPPGVILLRSVQRREGQAAHHIASTIRRISMGLLGLSLLWLRLSWTFAATLLEPLQNASEL